MENKIWGHILLLDLHECDVELLKNPEKLKEFPVAVCNKIGMELHGEPHFDRFGEGNLEGWSLMQFIKTSTITVHLDEVDGRAFIDIFSCKSFDPKIAEEFSKEFFCAKRAISRYIDRG